MNNFDGWYTIHYENFEVLSTQKFVFFPPVVVNALSFHLKFKINKGKNTFFSLPGNTIF